MNQRVQFTFSERIKYSLDILLKQNSAYHILFWLLLYVTLALLDDHEDIGFRILKEGINVTFFAIMVYVNLQILFPLYNKNKLLLLHVLLVVLVAVLLTPIKTAILYAISYNHENVQRYLLDNISAIFLSTFFIGISSSVYGIMREWIKTQQEKQDLIHRSTQTELKFLRSQINPHFLFNTLNSLYALTLKKSDKAPEVVLKISETMRYMLYECNEPTVPLHKEVQHIENYLELEKIRHGESAKIDFELKGDIENQAIAPLIFITFIENCFKHGFNNIREDRWMHISLEVINDKCILITKNKISDLPLDNKKDGGIGLINVRKRLNILYPESHTLNITQNNQVYTVRLELKL